MHQWLVIQWLLFILDVDTFIRMIRIVPSGVVTIEDYIILTVCSRLICYSSNKDSNLVIRKENTKEDPNSFVYILHDPTTSTTTLFSIHNSCTLRVSEGMWFSNFYSRNSLKCLKLWLWKVPHFLFHIVISLVGGGIHVHTSYLHLAIYITFIFHYHLSYVIYVLYTHAILTNILSKQLLLHYDSKHYMFCKLWS